MSSFTRYAAVAVVVLSLGFLVASAPATSYATVPAVTGKDAVSLIMAKFCVDVEAHLKALFACGTVAELKVAFGIIVAACKSCGDDLLRLGANVAVEAEAKVNIATCVGAIITLYVQVCLHLIAKFGISAVVELSAQVDVMLRACLLNLNICIDGIIALIVKALVYVTASLLTQVNLKLCMAVLGL